ncbi:glycosyltransferase family 2 protein [Mucilaginibacter sp. RS28]|uniref:Glycosyltransferase family 2 protein n=1 Tax=Mucilaginibacter straminoryzae TaxID=2932774 RepID=A0A9X1X0J8_9SPHI|nr:glycosyltransferase family 2 protein [Mucilaginibacter straminoryzae]MCJ8208571.1 glycosyltransferase family 2 protein [Mucilaginibacter straminoryzae]
MIAILLSTYNGEKYLPQQLDSLLTQTYKDFTLHIRDDGSTDGTLAVLNYYKERYPNVQLYLSCKQDNKGVSSSFMWLLKNVEADYYMFCDQDDVWLPSKIQLSIDAMKAEEIRSGNLPILLHSDLIVSDVNLNIVSKSLWENNKSSPSIIARKYLKLVNYVTGCTILINSKVKDIAFLDFTNEIMHDHWLAMCVDSSNGVIISLTVPTLYYRQHGGNVIGSKVHHSKFPTLSRYFHLPDFDYSIKLYKVLRKKYKMNAISYLFFRLTFYVTN